MESSRPWKSFSSRFDRGEVFGLLGIERLRSELRDVKAENTL